MSIRKNIPSTASVAFPGNGHRLIAPAADRNIGPILDLVIEFAPDTGKALELASGTGQHIVKLASAKPNLNWQPSDVDQLRIASITSWRNDNNLDNLNPPLFLDATEVGWSRKHNNHNFILLVNLIHLISEAEATTIIHEISIALAPGGRTIIYGPFKKDGKLTSAGDISFHRSLKEADTEIGYKDDKWMIDQFSEHILKLIKIQDMPANNLAFIIERPLV